ncbi:MAG: hypothetical protein ACW98Y_12205 [Candidatus Thorarchaeota archaeon]
MTEDTYDDGNSHRFAAILMLLLVGSPGSLLIYVAYTNFTPLLLVLIIPLTLIFVYGFVIFVRRSSVRESTAY